MGTLFCSFFGIKEWPHVLQRKSGKNQAFRFNSQLQTVIFLGVKMEEKLHITTKYVQQLLNPYPL